MHFTVSPLFEAGRSITSTRLIGSFFIVGLSALYAVSFAQSAPSSGLPAKATVPVPIASTNTYSWAALNKAQQTALAPLSGSWEALSEGQKRKWLAVASNYPDLRQAEQEKLHSRMAEWAALSPKDREVARLNFAQSKAITKTDRAANWEAYQALSPDERKKLADGAKVKPVGAAVAVKPVAPEKLTAVPITRRTPEAERQTVTSQTPLNRNTLLPKALAPENQTQPMAPALPSKP